MTHQPRRKKKVKSRMGCTQRVDVPASGPKLKWTRGTNARRELSAVCVCIGVGFERDKAKLALQSL